MSLTGISSRRAQSEADEAIKQQLANLNPTTPREQEYAGIANSLIHSIEYWKARAESERRKAEMAASQSQHAIHKLMQLVQSEGEALLKQHFPSASTGNGPNASSSPISHLSFHPPSGTHPSHLSRRVSFNRDINIVVSPEIGSVNGEGVARVDEDEEFDASSSSSLSTSSVRKKSFPGVGSSAHDGEVDRSNVARRLSRTEINEGAILKQHLDLSDLEKEEIGTQNRASHQ